jgi:hypothetical protein
METSMRWLSKRYDPTGKRMPRSVRFYGVIESVDSDHFLLRDTQSDLKGACYLTSSAEELEVTSGDTVQVNGIYSKVSFEPDTVFTFLNCIIIEEAP